MLNLALDEILTTCDALAAKFAARADDHDRDGSFAAENAEEMRQAGLCKLTVPVEYDGNGGSAFDMTRVLESIAIGDGSTALGLAMHLNIIGQIAEQRPLSDAVMARLFAECVQPGIFVNNVASEPEMGSPSRGGLPRTTAIPTEHGYLINGRKSWVTYAPALDYFLITATLTEPNQEPAMAVFAVAGKSPGLTLIDTWGDEALSLRASGSCDVNFENVFVPEFWHVETRRPDQVRRGSLPPGWSGCAFSAVYLGIGEAALRTIARYAKQRVPTALGKPIAELPHIQKNIGQMEVILRAARMVLYGVAQKWSDCPDARATMEADLAIAKHLCTNAAIQVTDLALRTAGAAGLDRRLPLERLLRDARAGLMHPPQDEPAMILIGKSVLARF